MAIQTTIDDITYEKDWGGKKESDSRGRVNNYDKTSDELPYSGLQIQQFIKNQFGGKFGYVSFTSGTMRFYDKQGGTELGNVVISGTVYQITLTTTTPSYFDVLVGDTSKVITITPSSQQGVIGGQMQPFPEDYSWVVAVDTGEGFIDRGSGTCLSGSSFSFDIRPYLQVGSDRIRFTVTGDTSHQVQTKIFSCQLTELTFRCEHAWWQAWREGGAYSLNGIYFAGSIAKKLHVVIDNSASETYTQDFTAQETAVTRPYSFALTTHFPATATTSGIHTIEAWMTNANETVSTKHYTFNLMCVKSGTTPKLCCINEVANPAVNYVNQVLFKYAVYGITSATIGSSATASGATHVVIPTQTNDVIAEQSNSVSTTPEIETELQSGITLTSTVSVTGGNTATKTVNVDNSHAYIAVSGAEFYMNPSQRNNGNANRTTIVNVAPGASTVNYPGTFNAFAFLNDGWATDDNGRKCLSVLAGSTLSVPTMLPLNALDEGNSMTLEWKMKTSNVSDYSSPIMSFMTTPTYDVNTSKGVIVFPTRIAVLIGSSVVFVNQFADFKEEEEVHVAIVFQIGYKSTGRNLCRIYINGMPNCTFEYTSAGTIGSNAYFRAGQDGSDLYLYMMRWYIENSAAGKPGALETGDILQNYLNTLSSGTGRQETAYANDIMLGSSISYELCKQKGYNTMVIETAGDVHIPDLAHTASVTTKLTMEYADNPSWNFSITNATCDGQGTTSKKYYRWNLRWKLSNSSTWTYADGTTETKKGVFDGKADGVARHPKVSKITAKKNVASSPQGHKMGACALYDDLYKKLNLGTSLPAGARVATYQYPVFGFHKTNMGGYEFVGLYTIGPDKGDDNTFGYNTTTYPSLLSIEGPNHAPLGTRFIVPWVDAEYKQITKADGTTKMTLAFGNEEGWDVDTCPYDESQTTEINTLFTNEWKPAYELVFNCSPWLASLAETGHDLAWINANIVTFRGGTDLFTTRPNGVATLYDSSYNLIYYSIKDNIYKTLATDNLLTYLAGYLNGAVDPSHPTTAELIAARKAKFADKMGNLFDKNSSIYCYCYCVLIGATDNFAKNSYPFKLAAFNIDQQTGVNTGGKWMWRQDDLDTILPFDNNGNTTKEYYIDPGDVTSDNVDIFQGASSAFWTLIEQCFQSDIATMMSNMVTALRTMAAENGISTSYAWTDVLAMFNYYFWSNSSRYFPMRGYNEDAYFAYIDVWELDPTATYNDVMPLSQAKGSQFEAEIQWASMRIIYLFSKYSLGAFNVSSADDGCGSLEFTPANGHTFNIKPAVWLYPAISVGGGTLLKGGRTTPAQTAALTITSSTGDTTHYIKGLDFINELGDLSGLILTSRGLGAIVFSVNSKRLKKLKVGAASGTVSFNAQTLLVSGKSLQEIDARRVTTITSALNLASCPRLRKLLLAGSSITDLTIPAGTKVNEVSLPDGIVNLYLNTLPVLTTANLTLSNTAKANITDFYARECPNLGVFGIMTSIMGTANNHLRYVTVHMGNATGQEADIDSLYTLATPYASGGYGQVTYNENTKVYGHNSGKPDLQGVLTIPEARNYHQPTVTSINQYFNNFNINVTKWLRNDIDYVWFKLADVIPQGAQLKFTSVNDCISSFWWTYVSNLGKVPSNWTVSERQCGGFYISIPVDKAGQYLVLRRREDTDVKKYFGLSQSSNIITSVGGNISWLWNNATTIPISSSSQHAYCDFNLGAVDCSQMMMTSNTISESSFYEMFQGQAIVHINPNLFENITTISHRCCEEMFASCTSLVTAPNLPNTLSAPSQCYRYMFNGCTSLTSAPNLPATSLGESCYNYMFSYCERLASGPSILPAPTLTPSCYYGMFQGCGSLIEAPILPALTLVFWCYKDMFSDCTNLRWVKCLALNPSTSNTSQWLHRVSTTGVFVQHISATWELGESGIPGGWTIVYYDPTDNKHYLNKQKTRECDDHGNPITA